ncbi:hypothetical protein Y1Q_0001623 [Alligator mississippiensis]|uniref:Uncharacterized protein n=1 Tax=Alligator mississippiensis TaxID=8496 RepID=A0A151MA56_ALLMI|nr:hypothetical protein Y1Q_0001623 [Alligator mississippiensis]
MGSGCFTLPVPVTGNGEPTLHPIITPGPSAFSAFCSILEEVYPHLLTCFLLDYKDQMQRSFPDLSEETKMMAVSEMELHETCETNDQEGNPSAEDPVNQSFNKYRLK